MMWLAVGALKNIVEHVPFDKWYDNPLTNMFLDGLKTPTSFGTHGLTMVVCFSIWSHWWWQSLFMLNMFFFDDTCAQLSRSFLCMTTCCIHVVIYIMLLFLRTCIIIYIVTHIYIYIYYTILHICARLFRHALASVSWVRRSVSLSGKFIKAKSNLQQLELQLLAIQQGWDDPMISIVILWYPMIFSLGTLMGMKSRWNSDMVK